MGIAGDIPQYANFQIRSGRIMHFVGLVEGPDTQIDIGIALVQGIELWRQPECCNAGSTAYRNHLILPVREQLIGHRIEAIQRLMHGVKVGLARAGERQSAMVPDKESCIQIGL